MWRDYYRAEAMALRDARGQAIGESDWSDIEGRLERAYRQLAQAVASDARGKPRARGHPGTKKPRSMPGLFSS